MNDLSYLFRNKNSYRNDVFDSKNKVKNGDFLIA